MNDELKELGLNITIVNPHDLKEYPQNYNTHPPQQLAELKKSLHGPAKQYKNIVVWNGYTIAGNGLVKAAVEHGDTKIAVNDVSHLSKDEAEALLISDNATPFLAAPDPQKLQELLDGLGEMEIPGVTDDWLNHHLQTNVEIMFDDMVGNSDGGAWSQPSSTVVFWIYDKKFQTTEEEYCNFIMENKEKIHEVDNDRLVDMVIGGLREILSA